MGGPVGDRASARGEAGRSVTVPPGVARALAEAILKVASAPAAPAPRKPPRPPAPCGTHAAFAAHRRAGEVPDEACRQARRDYQSARTAARRDARAAYLLGLLPDWRT